MADFCLSSCSNIVKLFVILTISPFSTAQSGRNLDQFNYGSTSGSNYGPADWGKIQCPDVNTCLGWPDKFQSSQGWNIDSTNHCINCAEGAAKCGVHHNSPINVNRNRADKGSSDFNECIDSHWMAYFDSGCTFDDLKKRNAFTIERHALKITQPMSSNEDGGRIRKLECSQNSYGRIDFPKGYSQWWYLSHIDFHVPSEHTQNGKRYSGELQMYHFYSVTGAQAGVDNELASVTIFLDVRPKQADWPILNRIICAWREAEEKNRAACGLGSIRDKYDGCTVYSRGRRLQKVNETLEETTYEPATSAYDIIYKNEMLKYMSVNSNVSYEPTKIHVDQDDSIMDDFDWQSFITERENESIFHNTSSTHSRKLADYDDVKWFNYFPLTDVKTEYYFRYSGSQTIPPCYGKYFPGDRNRHQTTAWRVMKDPMLISERQLNEMHRLLRMRIAPKSSPVNSCKEDTAAKIEGSRVNVARPLQQTRDTHYMVFCECDNWKSKFKQDQDWCSRVRNKNDRLYKDPYNFGGGF